jgi:tetratricopeptide (TPR) repeat protein/DNA-binding XRE family transcriptional regulator
MTSHDFPLFGALLQTFRKRAHRTQQMLAEAVGVHRRTLVRWEQGDSLPESKALVLELAHTLKLDDQETRQLLEASLTARAPYWHVPLPRNLYFTGREEVLKTLHTQLGVDQAVALTQSSALHGLGGVGKTQIALEYAYRYTLEYSAVFWVTAETDEQVVAAFLCIAEVLQLPQRANKEQQQVIAAVQRWLSTHGQWLLICDNVEDLDLLPRFFPPTRSGAVLITTRHRALGTLARGMDLAPMGQEESLLFLLRRGKMLDSEAISEQMQQFAERMPALYAAAAELVTELGGLPLALDQAGAYLEETQCGLPAYLDLFRARRAALLQRRGARLCDHPASVFTTLTLALRATAEHHPAVLDLLRVCALLQPDAIPEEIFLQGGEHLGATLQAVCGDPLEWDRVVGMACSYSLLSRQPEEQTLSLHRLVQAVLLDTMTEAEQAQWSQRIIRALDMVFPELAHTIWKRRERLFPHVLLYVHCIRSTEEYSALASLTYKTAHHLYTHGRYTEAEPLFRRALQRWEQALGPDHLNAAQTLHHLAITYWAQGKYTQSEPVFLRLWQLWEQAGHPEATRAMNSLAVVYAEQGKYTQAETLYLRVLHIWEQTLDPGDYLLACIFNNLADLYMEQGKHTEAEPLYLRAFQIWEQTLGPDHPDMDLPCGNLAALYVAQRRYEEAEVLYQRAWHLQEHAFEPDHPRRAETLNGMAILAREQGEFAEAASLFLRALSIREHQLGPQHPLTATTLHDLAMLRKTQGNLDEAISVAERALKIRTQSLGEAHPKTVATNMLYVRLVQEQTEGREPTLEHIRTLLKARGWSVHLKKRRSKTYIYATRKAGQHTHSRYLAPLSNLTACLVAARTLPNDKR